MKDYIIVDDLMDIASIDGDYNKSRVEDWRSAGIAILENATGYNLQKDAINKDEDKKPFIDLANIYLQEYARSNYLAPNYPAGPQQDILKRLQLLAIPLIEKMEEANGQSVSTESSDLHS